MRIGKCYKCGRRTYFTKKRKALCKECHKNAMRPPLEGTYPKSQDAYYRSYRIKAMREKVIKKYKRCQLCGTTENLTVHHIGGSTELGLTCLCDTCHQAYEHWHRAQRAIKD